VPVYYDAANDPTAGRRRRFDDQSIVPRTVVANDAPGYRKFVGYGVAARGNAEEPNFIILRYSDVLLMLAEALNEVSGGPTTQAYDYLNQVKRRALGNSESLLLFQAGKPGRATGYGRGAYRNDGFGNFADRFFIERYEKPGCLVVINTATTPRKVVITVKGNRNPSFAAYRTTGSQTYKPAVTDGTGTDDSENYLSIGAFKKGNGSVIYEAPAGSVTTFYGQ
jgi:hypothetical protein